MNSQNEEGAELLKSSALLYQEDLFLIARKSGLEAGKTSMAHKRSDFVEGVNKKRGKEE